MIDSNIRPSWRVKKKMHSIRREIEKNNWAAKNQANIACPIAKTNGHIRMGPVESVLRIDHHDGSIIK